MKSGEMRKDNARSPEQLARMNELFREKNCFFCGNTYIKVGASPSIYKTKHWYVKKNDYPYEGSVHHYLIVSKKHIAKVTQLKPCAWVEFLKVVKWIEKKLMVKGGSMFVRFGDMRYTGATLDHLHFHLIVGRTKKKSGGLEDNILVTLGHKK
jgi:ATP adenylyltransferase